MLSRQMGKRRGGEIAMNNIQVGRRFGQLVDHGGGQLAAGRVAAKNAGIEVQKFHGMSPPLGCRTTGTPLLGTCVSPRKVVIFRNYLSVFPIAWNSDAGRRFPRPITGLYRFRG